MKSFRIDDHLEIVCRSENTSYGFRHLAALLRDGCEQETAKCCYYNRTWERYEFQTVIENLIGKANSLSEVEKVECLAFINKDNTDRSLFKTTASIALMGEVLCSGTKEKNDWKKRMLKAGITGLNIPDDWDKLSEEEKELRLNKVIKTLQE